MTETKERLHVQMDSDLVAWLREESDARRCSIGALVRLSVAKEKRATEATMSTEAAQRIPAGEGKP